MSSPVVLLREDEPISLSCNHLFLCNNEGLEEASFVSSEDEEEDPSDQDDEVPGSDEDAEEVSGSDEESDSDSEPDLARGKGNVETSSDDEEDDVDVVLRREEEELEHAWGDLCKDAPRTEEVRRWEEVFVS